MYVKIFSNTVPDYVERMTFMSEYAKVWMLSRDCGLELLPKE